jgi:hypothetical protein
MWLTIICSALRLIGLIEWAEKWEQQYKKDKADHVQSKVNSMSDAAVSDELHKFERD